MFSEGSYVSRCKQIVIFVHCSFSASMPQSIKAGERLLVCFFVSLTPISGTHFWRTCRFWQSDPSLILRSSFAHRSPCLVSRCPSIFGGMFTCRCEPPLLYFGGEATPSLKPVTPRWLGFSLAVSVLPGGALPHSDQPPAARTSHYIAQSEPHDKSRSHGPLGNIPHSRRNPLYR